MEYSSRSGSIIIYSMSSGSGGVEDCLVCMEGLGVEDCQYPLLCPTKCGFNMCVTCIEQFVQSSQSDYQEASDGHLAVKVKLQCPQCRGDLSTTIHDTLLCRQMAIQQNQLTSIPDSELTAQDLQTKHSIHLKEAQERLEQLSSSNNKNTSMMFMDRDLFGGLDFVMSEQEQYYISQLMSSGNVQQLAQAAQILSGMSDLLRQGLLKPSSNTSKPTSLDTMPDEFIPTMQIIGRHRKFNPLPKRMPIHIQLEPFLTTIRNAPLRFHDHTWDDGRVSSAFAMATTQKNRIVITRVRGKAAKYGIQKGDVITHVNGELFTGTAQDLNNLLHKFYHEDQPPFSLVVNAEENTAFLLKQRASLPLKL